MLAFAPLIIKIFAMASIPLLVVLLLSRKKNTKLKNQHKNLEKKFIQLSALNHELKEKEELGSKTEASRGEVAATIKKAYDQADLIIETSSKNLIEFEGSIKKNTDITLSMVKNIGKVNEQIDSLKSSLTQLSKSSEGLSSLDGKLSEIDAAIKMITDKSVQIIDIAFQAKLLSFNASVEASRAGEHGKGFAVVATEMGNLAGSTQTSSEDISKSVQTSNDILKGIKQEILSQVQNVKITIENFNHSFVEAQEGMSTLNLFSHELKQFTDELDTNVKQFSGSNKTGLESLTTYLSDCIGVVTNTKITNLSPQEAYAQLNEFIVIDVRRQAEYTDELGHIENSILMTLQEEIEPKLQNLERNKKYLFVCRSGGRSSKAARIALNNQFPEVYNLDGGMLNWKECNLKSIGATAA